MKSLFRVGVVLAIATGAFLASNLVAGREAGVVSCGPPIPVGQLSSKGQTQMIRLQADPLNASVVARTLDLSSFDDDVVTIILGDATIQLTKQFSTLELDGGTTWAGKGDGFNSGVFAISNGQLSGTVQTASGVFQIFPLDGNIYAFIAIDMSLLQRRDD